METLGALLIVAQLIFSFFVCAYIYSNVRQSRAAKTGIELDSKTELEKIKKMRAIRLNSPLSEKTRPSSMSDIVGQEKGIKALRAALCGPSPQHVILYGRPGVGKTAAARLALEDARRSAGTPFAEDAPFVEVDATILQFDERSIADPLIGSVHDPIYQGAGIFGQAGVPQPKPGAVTNAHGGVLFIDEIGELHQVQMNKLLKVLEDRKVTLSSAYYSKENKTIPRHIHDLFQGGLPADFRLVGATTRRPEEMPPALRSRCTEVFFRSLNECEVCQIAENACLKADFSFEEGVPGIIARYSENGRDTVGVVQTAASLAMLDGRHEITITDVEEAVEYGRYSPVLSKKAAKEARVGAVTGLAVSGQDSGMIIDIEAYACPAEERGKGVLKLTGMIEEEELISPSKRLRRAGTAKGSVSNALTLIAKMTGIKVKNYDIHLNFPGGMPVDGPSAGTAIFTALYSALTGKSVPGGVAMTGEISLNGRVCPVGGVAAKIEAAAAAGAVRVFIPKENYQKHFDGCGAEIVCVNNVRELMDDIFPADGGVTVVAEYGRAAGGTL